MSKNLFKRIVTSSILLIILLLVIFSHNIIFIISLFTLCSLVCFEAYSIIKKMINKSKTKIHKRNKHKKEFSNKFLFLNILTFLYIFLIFFNLSYQIYIIEGPIFFLLIISVCFFSDIGGYFVGKSIGGKKLTKISPNKTVSGTIGSFIFSLIPFLTIVQLEYLDLELTFTAIVLIILISLIDEILSKFKIKFRINIHRFFRSCFIKNSYRLCCINIAYLL